VIDFFHGYESESGILPKSAMTAILSAWLIVEDTIVLISPTPLD